MTLANTCEGRNRLRAVRAPRPDDKGRNAGQAPRREGGARRRESCFPRRGVPARRWRASPHGTHHDPTSDQDSPHRGGRDAHGDRHRAGRRGVVWRPAAAGRRRHPPAELAALVRHPADGLPVHARSRGGVRREGQRRSEFHLLLPGPARLRPRRDVRSVRRGQRRSPRREQRADRGLRRAFELHRPQSGAAPRVRERQAARRVLRHEPRLRERRQEVPGRRERRRLLQEGERLRRPWDLHVVQRHVHRRRPQRLRLRRARRLPGRNGLRPRGRRRHLRLLCGRL